MTAPVGALRVTLGANTAQFEAGMRRAQNTARRTGQNVERSFSQMRVRTVQAFGAIRIAAAGLGLAMGATFFANQAREALNFAASLSETSRAIGVTVEQYQILNRAAIASGASTESMERAIGILNRTLGQARAGVGAAAESFRALGIDPEQFRSAGEVLPVVMEKIRGLRTVSEQAAAAQRLLGRGAAELIPLLIQGAAGWERYTQEARAAGLVTQEQADRADEASDKMALLGVTIRTNLASALVDILPVIEGVIRGIVALARTAAAAINAIRRLGSIPLPGGTSVGDVASSAWQQALRSNAFTGPIMQFGDWVRQTTPPATPRPAGAPAADLGDVDLDLSSGGGGGRGGGGSAASSRNEAARDAHEFASEMRRFQVEMIRAQQDQLTDAVARSQLDDQILVLEREQYIAEQELAVKLGDRPGLEADALIAARTAVDVERQGAAELERRREIEAETRELADARFEIQADALRQEADLATTQAERRDIELRLLDLAYRYERAKLAELASAEGLSAIEQQRAQMALDDLDRRHAGEQEGVIRGTRGPLEQWFGNVPRNAAEVNEALEAVAAGGLQSITDGLADAITMTRSWGDVFKNVAKQMLADLVRIAIQRAISMGLQAIGGSSGGIGGGLGGSSSSNAGAGMFGNFGGVRAKGGPVIPGRTYLVGERGPELLSMGGNRGYVTPNGAGRAINFDLRGAVMTQDLVAQMGAIGTLAAGQGAATGSALAQSSIHRRSRARIP